MVTEFFAVLSVCRMLRCVPAASAPDRWAAADGKPC